GRSDFTKLNLDLSRQQPIDDNWSFVVAAAGQYAFVPLLVAEQFGVGGTLWNRGFDPSETLGYRALAGTVQLRPGHGPGRRHRRPAIRYAPLFVGAFAVFFVRVRPAWAAAIAALVLVATGRPGPAGANPQGAIIVGGSAQIVQTSPTRLDINQTSNRAVID